MFFDQVINACAPSYSILATELTLKWNKVSGVYTMNSTGQLFPFVIGVAGFLKVFYDTQGKYKVRQYRLCSSNSSNANLQAVQQRKRDKNSQNPDRGQEEPHATLIGQAQLDHIAPQYLHNYGMQAADGKWV